MFKPERLKELRNLRKLSLRQLAQKVNLSHGYISNIETGRISPSLATVESLAKALGVEPTYFFENSIAENIPTTSQPPSLQQRRIELEQAFRDLLKQETVMFNGLPIGEYDEDILDDLELVLNAALKLVAERAEKEKKKKTGKGNFQVRGKGVNSNVTPFHREAAGCVRAAV